MTHLFRQPYLILAVFHHLVANKKQFTATTKSGGVEFTLEQPSPTIAFWHQSENKPIDTSC